MCGIVGYVGTKEALPVLVEGLKRLEYRGYDSAGVALVDADGTRVTKSAGRVSVVEQMLDWDREHATTGIAHTRWATHGAPNDVNAHPHCDASGRIALVHNGIIENYAALRTYLTNEGV
ncbi:MAG: glutamine--fructose-6-phosphate aminotransferase, partial [Planctomycetes bacterium]|nr:glutamine--fructose-6-phosphate aminotransferase [Planctomycetota bacterium]